jgi:hypothetical protein
VQSSGLQQPHACLVNTLLHFACASRPLPQISACETAARHSCPSLCEKKASGLHLCCRNCWPSCQSASSPHIWRFLLPARNLLHDVGVDPGLDGNAPRREYPNSLPMLIIFHEEGNGKWYLCIDALDQGGLEAITEQLQLCSITVQYVQLSFSRCPRLLSTVPAPSDQ